MLLINFIAQGGQDEPDTLLIPLAMLSLFVLSAATMGFLFLYEPLTLWFDGKRERAVNFFLTMLATFGAITLALLATLFFFTFFT